MMSVFAPLDGCGDQARSSILHKCSSLDADMLSHEVSERSA